MPLRLSSHRLPFSLSVAGAAVPPVEPPQTSTGGWYIPARRRRAIVEGQIALRLAGTAHDHIIARAHGTATARLVGTGSASPTARERGTAGMRLEARMDTSATIHVMGRGVWAAQAAAQARAVASEGGAVALCLFSAGEGRAITVDVAQAWIEFGASGDVWGVAGETGAARRGSRGVAPALVSIYADGTARLSLRGAGTSRARVYAEAVGYSLLRMQGFSRTQASDAGQARLVLMGSMPVHIMRYAAGHARLVMRLSGAEQMQIADELWLFGVTLLDEEETQ